MITFIEQGNRIATENFEIGEIYTITFTNGNYKTMCCIGVGSDFVMFQDKLPSALFCLTLGTSETVLTIDLGGGGSGTMNYNELENKPQINGIILVGNKTAADLNLASTTDLNGKQDALTETQLTAVNSGITSSLVTQIGTNTTAISGKQDQLSTAQLTAVNSGITSSLVTQIGTNTTAISGKQDQLSTAQLTSVNSGITSSLVTQITTNQNNILLLETLNGAKNYAKVGTWSSSQVGTTVLTEVSQGVYELNGTAGSSPAFQGFNVDLPAGSYWLSGCPSGGGNDTYSLSVRSAIAGSTYANDMGSGDSFTLETASTVYINFRVAAGYTVNHAVFKPMIITMDAKNAGFTDFQPYTPTIAELYQMILNL